MKTVNSKFTNFVMLELLAFVPLVIVLGNLFPPIGGFKLHWIFIGGLFVFSLLTSLTFPRFHYFLLLLVILMIVHAAFSIRFSIADYIDFMAGPVLLVATVNTLLLDKFSLAYLKKIRKRFLVMSSIPVTIALFQYFGVLPLEFLNARYVNDTLFAGQTVTRVNGFLFHAVELAVLIFIFFFNLVLLQKRRRAYFFLVLLIGFEFITLIKSCILAALSYSAFYAVYIDRRYQILKTILIGVSVIFGLSFIYLLIPDIELNRFTFDSSRFKFPDELFTGRGMIWNIYIRGISNFTLSQSLFGTGFGSHDVIFAKNAGSDWVHPNWAPGPHNQLLDLFIGGGMFIILLLAGLFYSLYKKLKHKFGQNANFKIDFWSLIGFPLFFIGLTTPILDMFIFWAGLSVAIVGMYIKYNVPLDE